MSDRYGVELFDAGGDNPRLRWSTPGGVVAERRLDRADVDALIDHVSSAYSVSAPELPQLGAVLYRWLDGPTDRWLAAAQQRQRPFLLYVDVEERLRGLPWELMFEEGFVAVQPSRPVTPVRAASARVSDARAVANRPLRVLFMASSPLEVQPVLNFEAEEAVILQAAAGRVEVVVEESGWLEGLAAVLASFPDGYFDVLHLSGHAYIGTAGPSFVMEGPDGGRSDVSAAQIAAAVGGRWPGLVFLSGCSTSGSPNAGLVASMAEALVDAGALTVLGWALPVGDVSASALAAALYRALADGADLAQAVAAARRALFEGRSPYWHLLRLYADRTPMAPAVTPLRTPGRVRLRSRSTSTLFLDAAGQVKVADRAGFVGRRRELQALLRHLRPDDPATGPQVAVLHGMGGLGKSTLAARLLDRMRATHPQHAVWVGRLDEQQIITVTGRLSLSDPAIDQSVNELLNLPGTTLADRLRYVLDGPLADIGCVFVFDDFESGNLDPDGRGGYQVSAAALEVLRAFATAIARTGSPSRVVITSRHYFPLPPDVRVVAQPVSGLVDADLDKKLRLTVNLGPTGQLDAAVKQRAITASAGVPRLLETLDNLLGITVGDLDVLFAAIEATEVGYREQLLLQQLMDRQPTQVRQAIALAAIYEIAVPIEAIETLSPDEPIRNSIEAAVAVGLIQAGLHPTTNETRYLASPLLAPLVDAMPEQLDERQRREAQQRGAYYLYRRWVQPDAQ